MKKKILRGAIIVVALAVCLAASSCLSTVLTALELGYRNALDTGSISEREYAYGDANPLSVTFENGKMYAEWDVDNGGYTYALSVRRNNETLKYTEEDEGFTVGKVCLSDLGYAPSEDLSLSLDKTQKSVSYVRTSTVGFSYTGMNAKTYDTYVKPVQAGFKEIDYYIANRAEWFDFWSYLVIFREGCKYDSGCYELESSVFLGYDYASLYQTSDLKKAFAYEVYSAIDAYEDSAAYSYSFDLDASGKVAKLYLKFTYDVNPKYTSDSGEKYKNAVEAMETAHYFNRNNEGRTFAIDEDANVKGTIPVSGSDQLYFALKKGYRPDPVKGSNAYYLYEEMRRILSVIIADTDTQASKVHYIYDYIVNTVVYDYSFTDTIYPNEELTTGQLFSYRCLYMEGVFGLGDNGIFNDASRIAICDGLSKAFLSLCKIEGMEVLKISGTVNDEGHAWNKVKINGTWYMVDTTWGNSLDTNTSNEYLNHEYLLVPDDSKHKETPYITYPSATTRYDYGTWIDNNPNKDKGKTIRWPFGWGRSHYAA